jgi:hypothetical protein
MDEAREHVAEDTESIFSWENIAEIHHEQGEHLIFRRVFLNLENKIVEELE